MFLQADLVAEGQGLHGVGRGGRRHAQYVHVSTCHERYVVGWSCKGRGFCPSCGGRRMNAGALTLVDHVLPDVPLRQFVVTVPFPLRFPLAFDGKLLSQVVRIFIDTVAANYRKRLAERGIPGGKHGAVAVIQRANSDLRCNPHVHAIFLDGLC
jgi:Transposase zinc-binding domain/Putative transposase